MDDLLDEADYTMTQEQLLFFGGLIRGLTLQQYLNTMAQAEATGPILDPTLYRAAAGNLRELRRLAEAALAFQKVANELVGKVAP